MDNEKKSLKLEVVDKLANLAISGLGLVAALAWNDAIQEVFKRFFPSRSGLIGMFAYAIFITVLIVAITINLGRISDKLRSDLAEWENKRVIKTE